ncbi:hypothetical protein A6A03_19415 [Chloroflexus islandicus]|uniref:Uncharacterized protein n=1 Tax=Chloroflexus islandicus TaxID=1707952 RepID=A0A178LZ78_9CHLR|nr:hypothetical protein A6A03_19415 [Chloroflexus islandicus]
MAIIRGGPAPAAVNLPLLQRERGRGVRTSTQRRRGGKGAETFNAKAQRTRRSQRFLGWGEGEIGSIFILYALSPALVGDRAASFR